MTNKNQIYKCDICGNVVEVTTSGKGTLVCCNQNMTLLESKSKEEGVEKHLPSILKTDTGIRVQIGDVEHPMIENHYIEWIECIVDGNTYRKYLNPGDQPVVEFNISGDNISVRAYCNIHGLWEINI